MPWKKLNLGFIVGSLVFILVMVVLMNLADRGVFSGEPIIKGRSVNSWLNRITYFRPRLVDEEPVTPNEAENQDALAQIAAGGSNSVPILIKILKTPPPQTLSAMDSLRAWTDRHGFPTSGERFNHLADEHLDRQHAAALALLAIDDSQGGGVLPLVEIWAKLPDPYFAIEAPFSKSETAIPNQKEAIQKGLRKAMQSTYWRERVAAVVAAKERPQDFKVWKTLMESLTGDENQYVRLSSLHALSIIRDPDTIELFERVLSDESKSTKERGMAAEALGTFGLRAQNAVPLLQSLTNHADVYIRQSALESMRKIQRYAGTQMTNR